MWKDPARKASVFSGAYIYFFQQDFHLQKIALELSGLYSNSNGNSPCTTIITTRTTNNNSSRNETLIEPVNPTLWLEKIHLPRLSSASHAPSHTPPKLSERKNAWHTAASESRLHKNGLRTEDFADFPIQGTCIGTFDFLLSNCWNLQNVISLKGVWVLGFNSQSHSCIHFATRFWAQVCFVLTGVFTYTDLQFSFLQVTELWIDRLLRVSQDGTAVGEQGFPSTDLEYFHTKGTIDDNSMFIQSPETYVWIFSPLTTGCQCEDRNMFDVTHSILPKGTSESSDLNAWG